MSETQKREAKRIVELLIENSILGETKVEDSSSVLKRWLNIQQPARDLFEDMLARVIAQIEAEEEMTEVTSTPDGKKWFYDNKHHEWVEVTKPEGFGPIIPIR